MLILESAPPKPCSNYSAPIFPRVQKKDTPICVRIPLKNGFPLSKKSKLCQGTDQLCEIFRGNPILGSALSVEGTSV